MRAFLPWIVSTLLLSGCYLFHRVPSDDASPFTDATDAGDAGIDASDERDASLAFDAGSPDPDCKLQTLRAGEMFAPVDMVWVVDSSRSMSDERARIELIMNQFVGDAEARNYDVHLIMVTRTNIVPPPLGDDSGRYRFVERAVGSNEPLEALIDQYWRYRDFLRPEASLHFVVVTDDDSALSAADFKQQMDRMVRKPYVVHAVASPDVDGQPCRTENATPQCENAGPRTGAICGASAIGHEYWELASELGGEEISVCTKDWSKVFGPLLEAVSPTEIPCSIDFSSELDLGATRVSLKLGEAAQRLTLVAGPMSCGGNVSAFYFADRPDLVQLTLCPATCGVTRGAGVELEIATHCD